MKYSIKPVLIAAIAAGIAACTSAPAPEQQAAPAPTTRTTSSTTPPPAVVTEVVTSTVANPPKPQAVVKIDDRPGYGALKLGMTLEEARAAGLPGLTLDEHPDACSVHGDIAISRKHGIERITLPEGARTSAGIGVGSYVAEMKRAYPNAWQYNSGFIAELNSVSKYAFRTNAFTDTDKIFHIKLLAARVNCPNAAL